MPILCQTISVVRRMDVWFWRSLTFWLSYYGPNALELLRIDKEILSFYRYYVGEAQFLGENKQNMKECMCYGEDGGLLIEKTSLVVHQ